MNKNYVAEPNQYPTVLKAMDYKSREEYNKRFVRTAKENAELFALKTAYFKALKKEHGVNWKKALRDAGRPFRKFNKSIVSGARVIAQWN